MTTIRSKDTSNDAPNVAIQYGDLCLNRDGHFEMSYVISPAFYMRDVPAHDHDGVLIFCDTSTRSATMVCAEFTQRDDEFQTDAKNRCERAIKDLLEMLNSIEALAKP